jgi:hypothetical protein
MEEFATAEQALSGPVDYSAALPAARLDASAPFGYWVGPDSSQQDAHSEQAGCRGGSPAGSQAAQSPAGLVVRRSPADPQAAH